MNFLTFILSLFKHFPKRLSVLLIVMFIAGLLESIGIGIVIPIFEFFFLGKNFEANSFISILFYEALRFLHIPVNLNSLFGLCIAIFALRSLFTFAIHFLSSKIIQHLFTTLSSNLMKSLIDQQYVATEKQKQGSYINLFTSELEKYKLCIQYTVIVISEFFLLLFYILLSFIISPPLTLTTGVFLSLSYLIIKRLFKQITVKATQLTGHNERYLSEIQEIITGMKWIKGSGRSYFAYENFLKACTTKSNNEQRLLINRGILPSFFTFYSIACLCIIAYLSLVLFKLNFPEFLLVTVVFYRIYPKFQGMQNAYQLVCENYPSVQKIQQSLEIINRSKEPQGNINFHSFKHKIELKHVKFSFGNDGKSFKLEDFNLTLSKNEFLAIIGPSGAGKSTLINLLTGIILPQSGELLIDGQNINSLDLNSYRKHLALVSQDTFLFNCSIRDNLLWGHSHINEADIISASKKAHSYDFIQALEHGFDTIIGDRGLKLSGGQCQRLALTRAILCKAEILILDEATSALDAESEEIIQRYINESKGYITLIIISHRLATIKQADRIIVMDQGNIIEEGTWKSLSQENGKFKTFKNLQVLDYDT